jgi:hypothetical protein
MTEAVHREIAPSTAAGELGEGAQSASMTRIYDSIFARLYDRALRDVEASGLGDIRRGLLGRTQGRTLEVGAGTGVNLPYYSGGQTRLVLTEPSAPMMRRLEQKIARVRIDAELVHAAAEHLPFERAARSRPARPAGDLRRRHPATPSRRRRRQTLTAPSVRFS